MLPFAIITFVLTWPPADVPARHWPVSSELTRIVSGVVAYPPGTAGGTVPVSPPQLRSVAPRFSAPVPVQVQLAEAPVRAPARCKLEGTVTLLRDGKKVMNPDTLVAYVKKVPQSAWEPPKKAHTVHQRNKTFFEDPGTRAVRLAESAMVIVKHDQVEFINDDKLEHSVFSASDADTFDFERSARRQTGQRPFSREGTIHVQCDIHPEMHLDVLVVRNPFFAAVGPDGHYAIPDPLPPGTYDLVAWEPRGGESTAKVTCEGGPVIVPELTVDEAPPHPLQHKDGSPYRGGFYQ